MAIVTLTDENFVQLTKEQVVLILMTNGSDKLRGDFKVAFGKAADEHQDILFGQVNPDTNSSLVEQFNYQGKSLMVGWYDDEVIIRQSRPWASDLPGAINTIQDIVETNAPVNADESEITEPEPTEETKPMAVLDKPMAVTDATFEKEAIEASNDMPVLVDFWAEWCGPCRMVGPILEKLAGEFAGQVRVVKVDTDKNPGLSQAFQIRSIPTIAVFKQGKLIFMQPGALPEPAFRDLIQQAIDVEIPEDEEATPEQ